MNKESIKKEVVSIGGISKPKWSEEILNACFFTFISINIESPVIITHILILCTTIFWSMFCEVFHSFSFLINDFS